MLNHIYRVVFNRATGCYVAVSEIAKSSGKSSRSTTVGAIESTNTVSSDKSNSSLNSGYPLRRHAISMAIAAALGLSAMSAQAAFVCVNSGGDDGASTATGSFATACGFNNNAPGDNSSAVGFDNMSSGLNSSAVGFQNESLGWFSSAVGNGNRSFGEASSAMGYSNLSKGYNSSAMGSLNDSEGDISSAMGSFNRSLGEASSAVGYSNRQQVITALPQDREPVHWLMEQQQSVVRQVLLQPLGMMVP